MQLQNNSQNRILPLESNAVSGLQNLKFIKLVTQIALHCKLIIRDILKTINMAETEFQGQLWVIEGADGAGKATQAKALVERLNGSGLLAGQSAHFWSFPTYTDPVWGKLIREYLTGPHHKAGDVDPKYASLLYAADRGKTADKLKQSLGAGNWAICDRYASSNMAHQGAKIKDIGKRN